MSARVFAHLPLGALRAFEAAVRLGSAKEAADEIGVTPAAVSHQIGTLESHLGTLLFERLHRELRPTPAGLRLAQGVRDAFDVLEESLVGLSSDGLIGAKTSLTISAAPTFAAKWLAPRLSGFQAAHPRVELRLRAEEALDPLGGDRRVDVAIRYGAGPFAEMLRAEKLWPSGRVVAVCAPALAAKLTKPADLLAVPLLRTTTPPVPAGASALSWEVWLRAAGFESPPAQAAAAPLFGATHLALEAAAQGQGVALSPDLLVEDDVKLGRLAIPFKVSIPDPFSYWLLYRSDRAREHGLRSFANWLRGMVKAPQ